MSRQVRLDAYCIQIEHVKETMARHVCPRSFIFSLKTSDLSSAFRIFSSNYVFHIGTFNYLVFIWNVKQRKLTVFQNLIGTYRYPAFENEEYLSDGKRTAGRGGRLTRISLISGTIKDRNFSLYQTIFVNGNSCSRTTVLSVKVLHSH